MSKSLFTICTLLVVAVTACSTDKTPAEQPAPTPPTEETETPAPPAPVTGHTLHYIPCSTVVEQVGNYGLWVGDYLNQSGQSCEVANAAPRFWDVNVQELKDVLKYCSGPDSSQTLRIYLGRRAFVNDQKTGSIMLADLMLIPLKDVSPNNDAAQVTLAEDLSRAHDLISPCPSTCLNAPSLLEAVYFDSVRAVVSDTCQLSVEDPGTNPCN